MSSKEMLTVPACEVTGLPLPVFPSVETGPFNFDHSFYPQKTPELYAPAIGGRALRICWGQDLNLSLHGRKHNIFDRADLPAVDDVETRFKLCVFACAGVVPREAIFIPTKREFEVKELNHEQMLKMAHPKRMRIEPKNTPGMKIYNRKLIGGFFAEYALGLGVDDIVSKRVIHGFLSKSTPPQRKFELGNLILKEASVAATESLADYYQDLKKEGYVGPAGHTGLSQTVRRFFTKDIYPNFYGNMVEALLPVA